MNKFKNLFFSKTLYLSSPQIFQGFLSTIVNLFIIVPRLGLEKFGEISLYIALTGFFSQVSTLPTGWAFNYINKINGNNNVTLKILFIFDFILKIFISLVAFIVLYIIATLYPIFNLDRLIIIECILNSSIISCILPCLYKLNLEEKYKSHFRIEFLQLILPILGCLFALNISRTIQSYFLWRLIFSIPIMIITIINVRPFSKLKYVFRNFKKYPKILTLYFRSIEMGIYEQGVDFFIKFYISFAISKYILGIYSLASSISRYATTINISSARRFRAKIHNILSEKNFDDFNKVLIKSNYLSIIGCSFILILAVIYTKINPVDFLGIFYILLILLLSVSYQKTFLLVITEALVRMQKIKTAVISNRLYIISFVLTLIIFPKSIFAIPLAYIIGNFMLMVYRYFSLRSFFENEY